MNWISLLWPLLGGISVALGLVYAVVWLRQRAQRHHLLFAVVAIAAGFGSLVELRLLAAETPAQFVSSLRLGHLTFGVAILLLPIFVRVRFDAGRTWLLATLTVLRLLVIAASLGGTTSVHLLEVVMKPIALAGGVAGWVPEGRINPMILVAHLNLLLVLVFLADVVRELRRRGDALEHHRARLICAAIAAHVVVGGGGSALVFWGVLDWPLVFNSPSFLFANLVLAYQLGDEVLLTTRERDRLGRSESLLRESEQSWELAGQIAGVGPWSWEAKTGGLTFSPRARELFGLEAEGEVGVEDWAARIHPEDVARVRRGIEESKASGASFERHYRIVLRDGQERWITSRASVERDAEGKAVAMHGVSFDMTGARRADAMFRAALEAAPDAIFLLDDQGCIRLANARASLMFGYTNEQLLGLSFDALVKDWVHRPERRKPAPAASPVPARERRAASRELWARRRDGMSLPVELALRPVDGGLLLASVSDITERLVSEHESAQQRNELAHLSRVAVIGEMSSSLAHELNQPLTAIVSNSQAALRFLDAGPDFHHELREALADIASSGTRAGEVIRRLRAMLRKDATEQKPVDINQLISEVMQLYRSDLINRGVTVLQLLDRDLPQAIGDRVQLQQVLLNLVINACDAMAGLPGERKLTIVSRPLGDDEVEFSVWDIGPGLAANRLEQVFEPFVTTKHDGMGLGLSVCKTIVKGHGGRIWAEDNDGPGASFHVALPVCVRTPTVPA